MKNKKVGERIQVKEVVEDSLIVKEEKIGKKTVIKIINFNKEENNKGKKEIDNHDQQMKEALYGI